MTSIDNLANEIVRSVQAYTDDVSNAIESEVETTAKHIRDDTEADAPKNTGEYAKGFKVTKQDRGGAVRRVVWNKAHSRRVHLLEFGHAKRGGGRVAARPHLRPAYDRNVDAMQTRIRRIIQNGG